jgi:ornithine carbamoyltransferase
LKVSNLTCVDLEALIESASSMKAEPAGWLGALAGSTVGCYFERTSLRARASVEAAAHRLGMLPIELDRAELPLDGEQPFDQVARLLATLAGKVLVVATAQRTLGALARETDVPVLNAISDEHDPCQALCDLLTLRERFGRLEGLTIAYVGDPGAVAHSLMEAGALMAMEVRVACPPARRPPLEVQVAAEIVADRHGGAIAVSDDAEASVAGADAVYTDVWTSDASEDERRSYRVTPALLARAKPAAVFMHCLPARPGEEVSAAVIDGPHSIVWEQAANRLPAEQAAIYALATADGTRTRSLARREKSTGS